MPDTERLAAERLAAIEAVLGGNVWPIELLRANSYTLLVEVARLKAELADARLLLDGWEAAGNTIARHIPEHYDSDGALVSIVEEWAGHAAKVVDQAHAWRKLRTDQCAEALDAAVEVIYPSEEYL